MTALQSLQELGPPPPSSCGSILKIQDASLITIPWKTGVLRWVAVWLYKETATVIWIFSLPAGPEENIFQTLKLIRLLKGRKLCVGWVCVSMGSDVSSKWWGRHCLLILWGYHYLHRPGQPGWPLNIIVSGSELYYSHQNYRLLCQDCPTRLSLVSHI